MARYLSLLKFTEKGARTIGKSTARAAAFRNAATKAGARIEAQFWTSGPYDGVIIISADDEHKALRCLAALSSAGNVRTETLQALDAKEFAAISRK